jgi:hypothetical protein
MYVCHKACTYASCATCIRTYHTDTYIIIGAPMYVVKHVSMRLVLRAYVHITQIHILCVQVFGLHSHILRLEK